MLRRTFLITSAILGVALTIPAWAADKTDTKAAEKKTDAKPAEKKEEIKDEKKPAAPKVEVVFCLDTTGSMGGLIQGAKDKIWAICNQIAGGKPSPELKVGLVAYRDKGDKYVTKVFDLNEDLDAIYGHLKEFKADGGGDEPEDVNSALYEAVNKIKWTKGDEVLRIIFLVGDAHPHMDYKEQIQKKMQYPDTCQTACKQGIIINTIQCGTSSECTKFWKDIASKAEGTFSQIVQDGGAVVVKTPFDEKLAEINGKLARSNVAYGSARKRAADKVKTDAAAALPTEAAAERAGYAAKAPSSSGGGATPDDLVQQVQQGKIQLKDVKKEELPEELQKMDEKQLKEHLDKVQKTREGLQKEALDLDKKRAEFIAKEAEKNKSKDGFDAKMMDTIRTQAKKVKIEYKK